MSAVDRDRWYTADFDALSWRDVHVHGFRIVEGEQGMAELMLDIDFIIEWLLEDGRYRFRVAQAVLQFHEVFALRFSLDYVAPSAGMTAFSIDGVVREEIPVCGDRSWYRWRIEINWPEGFLEFESPGFSQWLLGDVVEQEAQCLSPSLRI
jgi:hypothetical protein